MNKLLLSACAVAALAAGAAWAQDGGAECQAGSAWGTAPGCGAGPSGIGAYQERSVVPGVPPSAAHGPYGRYAYGTDAYGRVYTYPAYPYVRPSRRDRDGDGVRNNRDRYPDDPSRY